MRNPPQPVVLDIGRALSRSLEIGVRNAGLFGALAVAVFSPYLVWSLFNPPARQTPSYDDVDFLAATLAVVFLQMLLNGALAHGVVATLQQSRVTVAQCLTVAVDRFLTIFAVFLIQGAILAVPALVAMSLAAVNELIGTLALACVLAFGLYILVTFYLAVPAAVIERTGPVESLRRSAALTAGNRWRVIAIVLILLVINLLIHLPIMAATDGGSTWVAGLLPAVATAIVATINGVVVGVAYFELRIAHEGPPAA